MPREAIDTKEKLIRSGEHLFARQGVDGALTCDVVSGAGQANDSAVHYHFGSRDGLLAAILDKHIQRMETTRRPSLADLGSNPRLASLVQAIVEPVADELCSVDGRDFLRIIAQLSSRARAGIEPAPLRGTALSDQLVLLERACLARLPQSLAAERISLMTTMLTAALADRAAQIEAKRRLVLDHDEYVANLIAMLTAALRAPG